MAKKYYALLTEAGASALAQASVSGERVDISEMAVGDGGGSLPTPAASQTGLINEVFRAQLNSLKISETYGNVIIAEMMMPAQTGGFTLREAALFDSAGLCMAVANLPETYKPSLEEGSGRFSVIRIYLAVSNTSEITLIDDPGIIVATSEEVIQAKNEAMDYTDRAISEAVIAAKRDFWEEENPPGTVRFFAQNVDPNEKWPWSQWLYTGENRTIRVGKADGSDVATTGGSDTVAIERANLPAVQINVTGETSEQEEKTLTTAENGAHNHQGGDGAPGEQWREGTHGTDNQKDANFNLTSDAPAHSHDVTIPPHNHSITGKTENLGEGMAISVVEAHTLLMCWARVA